MKEVKQQLRTPLVIINELESSGDLKILVRSGFCDVKAFDHLQIYRYIDAKIQAGSKKTHAVNEAAKDFKVCNRTVFRILKTINGLSK